ncbi:MAG: maleylpyruvate isomerase family mycothiol-dependent enzyme [Acidimicrobiales bacterium]|jgi:uncharacterized protein (TIGR03083 family)
MADVATFDRLAAIASESARVAELAARTPGDARVPSCPDWDFSALVGHLGEVQRFWAGNVRAASLDGPSEGERTPPATELSRWLAESTGLLLAALAEASPDAPCWTWWGDPSTVAAVARHQVQEAAVHRWDAEKAVGTPSPLAPEIAHDGVAEYLEIMVDEEIGLPVGEVIFESTDTGGRWRAGAPGETSVVLRACASDLVLLLYGRLPLTAVEYHGDLALWTTLLKAADMV